uniref:Uncharacterized protein n=1 Tax=Panagrolaimus superbus TaxID=310955 RepID=A0A914ZAE1_9BILA
MRTLWIFLNLLFLFTYTKALPLSSSISLVKDIPIEFSSEPNKFIFSRNLITGEKYVKDLRVIDNPSPVQRIRLLFSTSEAVSSNNEAVQVFHMKLRWMEPDFWNDNFNETDRSYKILCEIEDENTGRVRNFLALTVPAAFNGYDEKYIFPKMPLISRCKISVHNSANLDSEWVSSSTVSLSQLFDPPLKPSSVAAIAEEDSFHKKYRNSRFRHHHRNNFWTHFRAA